MRIQILYGYRGERTQEQFMPPGEHEVSDDFGAYLIQNGHARPVEIVTPEPVTAPDPEPPVKPEPELPEVFVNGEGWQDYEALRADELRELAEARSLEVVGTGKGGAVLKADLIRALRAANEG